MLGITSVGIVSADNISDLIKVCPNGKVLNEGEMLNLSVKIFGPYYTQNATVTVSLPSEIKNLTSVQQNFTLNYGFNVLNFPIKAKDNLQYEGEYANIILDGNESDWIDVTRSKADSIGDAVQPECSSPANASVKASYDIQELKVNYNENNDTIYFLIKLNGSVGGSDNNISTSETYEIDIINGTDTNKNPDMQLKYNNNISTLSVSGGQINGNYSNNIIEFSITNASKIIRLDAFNIKSSTIASSPTVSCPVTDCTEWYYISFCKNKTLMANITINMGNETTLKNLTFKTGCILQELYCGDGICNASIGENCANCCDCFENPNVTLTKYASSFVMAGNSTNFSVKVKNNGICSIYNITLIDIMPTGLINVSSLDKFLSYLKGNDEYSWDISANSSMFVEGDNISIILDGNESDWINVNRSKADSIGDAVQPECSSPANASVKASYDIQELKVNYNENNDTIYFLIKLNGSVGGSDNNISTSETYEIDIINGTDTNKNPDMQLKYNNNISTLSVSGGQINGNYSNNIIEFSITNASKIIRLDAFNIKSSTIASSPTVSCPVTDCTEYYYVSFCKDKTLTNFANLTAYSENGTQINLNASANLTVSCKGCNTTITCSCYRDTDNDNYGNRTDNRTVGGCNTTCEVLCGLQTPKYVTNPNDCNDNNSGIHPGATDACGGNGIDEDCSGSDTAACSPSSSTSSSSSDSKNSYSSPSIITYATPSSGEGCQQDTACGTLFCYKTKCYDSKGDEDKDKINNSDERDKYKTDMLSKDTDKDGIDDYDEIFVYKTDALHDVDKDGDGIKDSDEILKYKTNPNNKDSDNDGINDYDEIFVYKTNPLKDEDKDSDGIKDSEEILKYKTNQLSNDTDSDKISDYDEIFVYKTDPTKLDSDGDGVSDYDEIFTYKIDPLHDADNDSDGIKDSEEILKYKTNATSNDTDNDGISDYDEIFTYAKYNLNPLSNDTDGDGASDYDEIFKYKTDPGDAKDKPGKSNIWWWIIIAIILFLIALLLLLFLLAKRRKASNKVDKEGTQPKEEGRENEGGGGLGDKGLKREASDTSQSAQEGGLGNANPKAYKPTEKGGQSGGLGGI